MEGTPNHVIGRSGAAKRSYLDRTFAFGSADVSSTQCIRSAVGRQVFDDEPDRPVAQRVSPPGTLLIVDHDYLSREILARNIQREGYSVAFENDGEKALRLLANDTFALVLWELELPGMSGLEMLSRLRRNHLIQHIPVVVLSEIRDTDTVVRCIEAGADDYLSKPFNPALLKARIRASIERKSLRDQEHRLLEQLKVYQERINVELADATIYLLSLLPRPVQEPFVTDWRFIPSSELGGDCFGYHWIDDDHFALYLLDVCGHGVSSALLSVTVLNVLRSEALRDTDFRDPSAVLSAANDAFPMEQQNNRYFTLWYGVYQRSARRLTFSCAGHPPALLFEPGSSSAIKLGVPGMVIGGWPGSRYQSLTCDILPGSRLFLFCDGAYEITLPGGRVYTLDEFAAMLGDLPPDAPIDLDTVVAQIRELRTSAEIEDDLSLIAVQF